MREIVFDSYDAEDEEAVSRGAWLILIQAIRNYPIGKTVEATARGGKLLEAIEAIGNCAKLPQADEDTTAIQYRWSLRAEGGKLLLEDATYDLLKEVIEWWRKQTTPAGHSVLTLMAHKPMRYLDDKIGNAKELDARGGTAEEAPPAEE